MGINGVVKDVKTLVNAKGAGKIVPGLNIALGAVDVVQGISKSEKQARKDGLRGHEITASKVGGALVDVGKVTKKLKSGVNSMIKGVSGWFK
ncbi:hypothetical protein FRO35_001860 [Enterococcus faecalis]|nr:hypothetical protein [Enterococcus faecalis]